MYKLLLIVLISSVAKCSPAVPIESEESEWTPPTDLNGVQEAINDVRILLADIAYVATQILQDLQSEHNQNHVQDAARLVDNVNDLLKALKVGIHQTLPSANSIEHNAVRSQVHMLHTLAASVNGLFKSVEHALRDFGTLNTYIPELNTTNEGLRRTTHKIMSILDEITTQQY